jgi:glycosyltransferase involved in cell wall biosynthesis
MTGPRVQLVIPAHNEAGRLPLTLARLRAHLLTYPEPVGWLEVIIVDNDSDDGTSEFARGAGSPAMPVRVVRTEVRGKGLAVRRGIAETTADVVGFMDADGATDLAALAEARDLIAAGADVAIGSRAVAGSVTNERHSVVRVQGARLYRRATRSVAVGINDTQCGFKLFRGEFARALFPEVRCQGFSFDVEVLARAQRHGGSIVEFPVDWSDVPGSTFRPSRHGAIAFWELAVIAARVRRVMPRPSTGDASPASSPLELRPAADA